MTIRPATPEEIPSTLALAREVFMSAVAPHYGQDGIRSFLEFSATEVMNRRARENYRFYVAWREEELIGMAAIRDGSHVAMLFVAPHAQRQGVGRRLLDEALSDCGEQAVTVNASPNACAAYLRLGFLPASAEQTIAGIRFLPMIRPLPA